MKTINPYLTFNGNCEEAFNFYKSIFGGEFTMVFRFKEMPPEFPVSEADKELLMHVSLPISKETILMGSDTSGPYAATFTKGNNFSLSVNTEGKAETDRVFNALSAGGQVAMPLANTFWGSYFGMLTDKFGIQWMISYDLPKEEQNSEKLTASAKQSN